MVELDEVSWGAVEPRVRAVNPDLSALLSALAAELEAAGQPPRAFVARYPYGYEVVRDGRLRIPGENERVGPRELWEDCVRRVCADPGDGGGGLDLPLSVVLGNSVEVTFNVDGSRHGKGPDRSIPICVLPEGQIYGVFEVLDHLHDAGPDPGPWTVVAGCRSAYLMMLRGSRPFRDQLHRELAGHGWDGEDGDNWALLRAVARRGDPHWHAEVLLLPTGWFTADTPHGMKFRELIGRVAWRQSSFLRRVRIHETRLQYAIHDCDPNMDRLEALQHLRHIISIGRGHSAAFRPLRGGGGHLGPFDAAEAFLRGLSARSSHPVFLVPAYLTDDEPVGYYSLTVPSLFGYVPDEPPGSWVQKYLKPLARLVSQTRFAGTVATGEVDWPAVRFYGSVGPKDELPNLLHSRHLCAELGNGRAAGVAGPGEISYKDRFLVACIKVVKGKGL